MRNFYLSLFVLAAAVLLTGATLGCGGSSSRGPVFAGEPEDVALAHDLFAALGGHKRWADMRSLYIKALHRQSNLKTPYQNEIWRSLDSFKLRIEQQNNEFHRTGLFSDEGGWIVYVTGDSSYQLTPLQLQSWRYSHEQNVYVLLHQLATEPGLRVHALEDRTLQFFRGSQWICSFTLDEANLPVRFIRPNLEGDDVVSNFSEWGKTNGYAHPLAGGPSDGSFTFTTEVWLPSNRIFEEAFEVDYRYEE